MERKILPGITCVTEIRDQPSAFMCVMQNRTSTAHKQGKIPELSMQINSGLEPIGTTTQMITRCS